MKKGLLVALPCMIILSLAAVSGYGQTDLNTRKAIYFTGPKADSINLASDPYAASGATLQLSAELRTTCDNNVCEFNVGLIVTRTGKGPLSTDIRIQTGKSGAQYSRTVDLAASEMSKQVVLPIKLNLGKNELTVTVDPANKTVETDEANNSFGTTVMVSWKKADPGNKK